MAGPRRVLVTGAGVIGTAVRRHLGDRYELHALTHAPHDVPSHVADIADLAAIRPAFVGMDAVVHLAASPRVDATWDEVLPNNIIGTVNVFAAARAAGVPAVIFASTNHVIGMDEVDGAPTIYDLDDGRMYDQTAEFRPDSLYGVSKIFGEALGRYYVERHGLRVICLRIGSVREDDTPVGAGVADETSPLLDLLGLTTPEEKLARQRAVWLSQRDCAELIAAALDTEHVRWAVVYGVSANPRRFWDIEHARAVLGWQPRDSAPRDLDAPSAGCVLRRHGWRAGDRCQAGHGDDEPGDGEASDAGAVSR